MLETLLREEDFHEVAPTCMNTVWNWPIQFNHRIFSGCYLQDIEPHSLSLSPVSHLIAGHIVETFWCVDVVADPQALAPT